MCNLRRIHTDAVEGRGRDDGDARGAERADPGAGGPARRVHHCLAPQAAPVLQPVIQIIKFIKIQIKQGNQ